MANAPVMIALDFSEPSEAEDLLRKWAGRSKPLIKIGYQLFYRAGLDWVARRKEEGYTIFLDLKLHDIPQTVAGAIQSLSRLGVDFLTVHAAGGSAMLEAAKQAKSQVNMKLLAVTQLTSTDQPMLNEELNIPGTVEDSVLHLSRLAYAAGVEGVICSGHEVRMIKQVTSPNFLAVTPGIRPSGSARDDQKRVVTPAEAMRAGADFFVMGRPITRSTDPLAVYEQVIAEIQQQKENG